VTAHVELGVVSGAFWGVRRQLRREHTRLLLHAAGEQRVAALTACRALGLGTLLCFGAFAGAGAVFSYTTGITSVRMRTCVWICITSVHVCRHICTQEDACTYEVGVV
jgi:hypothetical protein